MRIRHIGLLLAATCGFGFAQSVPTFKQSLGDRTFTLLGRDPAKGGTTTIPTTVVPIALAFESKPFTIDAARDVAAVLKSPIFAKFPFLSNDITQYADAMLRATFPKAADWHTLLDGRAGKEVRIRVPAGYGYLLMSKKSGRSLAVVDVQFLQREFFKKVPKQDGLVIAVTHNTTFYGEGDATLCCSWGTHGVDSATGNSFVLASYLSAAPDVVEEQDVQPLTQQLAEFVNDPLYDPLATDRGVSKTANSMPAWIRPATMRPGDQGACGGTGIASAYFLLEPTDTNPKNNIPASKPWVAKSGSATYHVQNAALLPWYTGAAEGPFSFPDTQALTEAARPCPARGRGGRGQTPFTPTAVPVARSSAPNGHELIGYWTGYGGAVPAREVSPQWDVVIVAFAVPDHNAPEGTMIFRLPANMTAEQFKTDIASLKQQGRKVMLSLGGGGQHFTLADPKRVPTFVSSVIRIVTDFGFDGIDIDFESPSLAIDPGDTDYRHPTTPSIVNLISALRQIHDHFGPGFMTSLVPEGTQIPSGYPSYGGQFGSYLPILHAIRDILSFVDVQDYNTPPLQGLDGEIYQPGTVDYHAAMTELLLHGFNVGGDAKQFFAAVPANQVAVGFLTGDTTPEIVGQAMDYIITGKAPAGTRYRLLKPDGYREMIGAMFWTLDADRRLNYSFSNTVGPQLHEYVK